MDSLPLQDRILSCKRPSGHAIASDDWLENKKFMEKRSAIMSKDQYALNWFHRDQFYEPHTEPSALADAYYDEGLPMIDSRQWQITATIPDGGIDNLVHYTYVEFARDILITPTGPMFLPNQFNP